MVNAEIEAVFRREHGVIMASLVRAAGGDFDAAEDALSEAFALALERWPVDGIPDKPAAWLTTAARNKAIDRVRRERRAPHLKGGPPPNPPPRSGGGIGGGPAFIEEGPAEVEDDRLRLIFTCCHPAIDMESRVALTLRTLGGLTTEEVARAFLVDEPAMAQRLVRVKKKIRDAGIPYVVPPREVLAERLEGVLAVVYLIFNEGYSATSGDALVRRELTAEAQRLAAVLDDLLPDEPEILGLRALMLLTDARREARVDEQGDIVLLEDQDRTKWDREAIEEGSALVERALVLGGRFTGPYAIQAAISAVHGEAERAAETDWNQIVGLYEALLERIDTPVVKLNHAVAVAMAKGPEAGLERIRFLEKPLAEYHLLHAARADLLRRLGRKSEAAVAYRAALALVANAAEKRFLTRRLREVT